MKCERFGTWNKYNAPPDDPRRTCDACGRVRAAHPPQIRRVDVGGWTWCSMPRQIEPACGSDEWIEYVLPAACAHCGARVVGSVPACGDGCPGRASLLAIVTEAAARFDKRPLYRASVEAQRELTADDDVEHCGQCGRALGNGFACGPECE